MTANLQYLNSLPICSIGQRFTPLRHKHVTTKIVSNVSRKDLNPMLLPPPGKGLSLQRKACYYWKDAVANDSAIDWSYILDILRKRIEYHIGYHRFTDRFENSKFYVSRMELCCRLLELAAADYYDMDGVYVNPRNASRYIGRIFDKYELDRIDSNTNNDEYLLSKLRRAKAYKILWKFLDHNLTYWWD